MTSVEPTKERMLPVPHPIACLAPMDGITDTAYRQIVRRLNPAVVLFSEFTNVNGILHSDEVRQRLNFEPFERPFIIQVFGNEPPLFAKIARDLQDAAIDGIDINMGCPSKRIVQANTGGSLMKDADLACRIVDATARSTSLPVSVKTRLGWSDAGSLLGFVRRLVDAGAQMVTVHGRTYQQKFKGSADWEPIYELRQGVAIPVIGNGDLTGRDQALGRLKNLDGYMIGRAAIGNPWVFWSDQARQSVTFGDKIEVMLQHFHLLRRYQEERRALIEFRKHISGYINGFNGAKACRLSLMSSRDTKTFIERALSLLETAPATVETAEIS
jgi:tRNA-dihydrouridine synthase B